MKRVVQGVERIAPISQLVTTACDKSGQKAEMWLQGFIFGLVVGPSDTPSSATRLGAFDQNGSWTGSWGVVADLLSYRFFGGSR